MSRLQNRRAMLGTAATFVLACTGALAVTSGSKPRVVDVIARKFEFVPPEIHVRRGEPVLLQFTAPEVPMGVNFADFDVRADIVPGRVASVPLVPEHAGRFTFVCDVFCGSGHEDMSGVLVVSE